MNLKAFAIAIGLLLTPPTEQEYGLLHSQERYGACWDFCRDDIALAYGYTYELLEVIHNQEEKIKNQVRYIKRLEEAYRKK